MLSLYIWQYYLIVPIAALASADAVARALALNPDGVIATFRRYPLPDAEGEYLDAATHYLASFVACDLAADGTPSREALGASSALSPVLWIRTANPHHPDTPPEAVGIVVASNWAAFAPGDIVDWEAVTQAVGSL